MAARLMRSLRAGLRRCLAAPLIALVRLYQLTLSPWLGAPCRFEPSCSDYALGALRRFGPWRGGWLALRRILRCHPWGPTGYDPVPDALPTDGRRGRQAPAKRETGGTGGTGGKQRREMTANSNWP